jgi:signal transduction histidine kinase
VRTIGLRTRGIPSVLTPEVDATAFEVAREALTNAEKHAGADTRITVDLQWNTDAVRIDVVNTHETGAPDAAPDLSGGYGLQSLRKRVQEVGGELTWAASPDAFRVNASFPISAPHTGDSIPRWDG